MKESGIKSSSYHNPVKSKVEAMENLSLVKDVIRKKLHLPVSFKNRDLNTRNTKNVVDMLLYLAKFASTKRYLANEMPKPLQQYLKENVEDLQKQWSSWNLGGLVESDDKYIKSVEKQFQHLEYASDSEHASQPLNSAAVGQGAASFFFDTAKAFVDLSHVILPTFLVGIVVGYLLHDSELRKEAKQSEHYVLAAVVSGFVVHVLHLQNGTLAKAKRKRR